MKDKKLNIVITVDPEIPVPPIYYGGIERIVDMLVRGLSERGHSVTLFAHADSKVPATLIPWQGKNSSSTKDTLDNSWQLKKYLQETKNVDIIHSFSRLAYLAWVMRTGIPKIQSYQRFITPRSVRLGEILARRSLTFCACSRYCALTAGVKGSAVVVIYNGVQIGKYDFVPHLSEDAPLVYLGRIEPIKGVHTAIAVALKAGRRLIIAGNYTGHDDYFKKKILPYCDSNKIVYAGEVDDKEKNILLGSAAALLLPVEWDEPFGIVMVEALACGTPVVAFNRGAVSEVVESGKTGFVCETEGQMVEAVCNIRSIERCRCRDHAEKCFSDKVIVDKYEQLYYYLHERR